MASTTYACAALPVSLFDAPNSAGTTTYNLAQN
jgi:hypothetical protein